MNPADLARRDLRRLVSEMWPDDRCDTIASSVLEEAVRLDAKSCDRAVILAYLRHFPTDHPAFDRLTAAASLAADRRDWPWRDRGRDWQLWDPKSGPGRLASALLASGDARAVLRETGLDGDMSEGEFVAEALETACQHAAAARGERAQASGERLISLFENLGAGSSDAMLAYALLNPWVESSPPEEYRNRIAKLLVARVGDPRMSAARWDALAADMHRANAVDLVALIRRWLTQSTVRGFFKIVGRTTNDPKQWAAREEFWLAYLDDGAIDDAWFAFGRQAEFLASGVNKDDEAISYGEITGAGADASHSALIMSIGDVRIAEWSHNGSCRFWSAQDAKAPALYKKQYFGMQLRAMNGGRGFDEAFAAIPHASGWQSKFAGFVYRHAGRRHPRWGEGHRGSGWY